MAGLPFNIPFKSISLAAAGTEKAIVGVKAPTQQDVQITDLQVMLTGTSGDAEPIEARLVLITPDGGTPSSVTAVKKDQRISGAVQSTCRTYGGAPTVTANTELWVGRIHPQGGMLNDFEFKDIWIARATEAVLHLTIPTGGPACKATGNLGCRE